MRRRVGVVLTCVAWLIAGALTARAAWAQGDSEELATRGPRFLLASATLSEAPVRMDVSRTPVLRQRISLDLEGATLGEALARIKQASGLQLVYSSTVVPLERPVHLKADDITVAGALTELLLDTDVDVLFSKAGKAVLVRRTEPLRAVEDTGAIVGRVTAKAGGGPLAGATVVVEGTRHSATTGNDGRYRITGVLAGTYSVRARYIGYAPATVSVTVSAGQEATADLALEKSAQRLNEVVTTGTVVPTEVKALPTPISVITGDEIEQRGYQRVDQIFRGDVPGAVAWDQGTSDYYSSVSVRGASSLTGFPMVKTFIDGVEMANGLGINWIATIDPNSIDRIEITRGPQASTLYGAGALNGVLQIFTKKGQLGLTRPELIGKVSAGGIGGALDQNTAFQTDNAISLLGGGEKTSYNLGGSYRHLGAWQPFYNSTDWGVSVGSQTIQGPLSLSGSARYTDKTFDPPWDTRLRGYTVFSQPHYETDRLRQQTYGVTAGLQATRTWQHTLTLGYDQTYAEYNQTRPQFTTPADSFMYVNALHEAKTSLLYHTDLDLRFASSVVAILTAGVNYDSYDMFQDYTYGATRTTGSLDGTTFAARSPWTNTGYFGQVQLNLAERLFLTSGLRAERNPNFGSGLGTAWSPRVGAAYVIGLGPTSVKLRASYGESIRAPDPTQRNPISFPGTIFLPNPDLGPERQRGADGGIEIYLGAASLGLTYYNQRAIDLIQEAIIPTPPGPITYQFQNVGRVKNEGWEFEAHLPLGPVQVAGTYSITNSTVQALSPSSPAGSYQVGDRVLGIPHTSAGATVTYSPLAQTTLTASMTHFGHWIEHDSFALYGYYYGGQPYRGSDRAYWTEYPTITKFAVGVSQGLRKDVTAFVRAENLGNNLRYELNSNSIPKPRNVVVGANVRY